MKLRKINDIHFVITDGNPTTNGDYAIHSITLNVSQHHSKDNSLSEGWEKIEFSTQPLDVKITDEGIHLPDWSKVKALSPKVVKELIGKVDVEKKAHAAAGYPKHEGDREKFYIKGYTQALEDNKEKKYTKDDLRKAWDSGREYANDYWEARGEKYMINFDNFIQSLQPKTEWEVEIIDGKLKLK